MYVRADVRPPPRSGSRPPRGGNLVKNMFSGGVQCAKISQYLAPKRCYRIPNDAVQWSDGAAQARLPGSCTWSLRSPALGPILSAPFGVSKPLPGPVGVGWGWAGPGRPRGLQGGGSGPPQATPRGENLSKSSFWWSPVCQNVTILGPVKVPYGAERRCAVVTRRRPAPGCPDLALGAFGGPPWARS